VVTQEFEDFMQELTGNGAQKKIIKFSSICLCYIGLNHFPHYNDPVQNRGIFFVSFIFFIFLF